MGWALLILGLIAAGTLVAVLVRFTLPWIVNRVKSAIASMKAKKVFVTTMERLVEDCPNTISLSNLEAMSNGRRTYVVADIDSNDQPGHVDIVQDANDSLDEEVAEFLGKEGKVVIER